MITLSRFKSGAGTVVLGFAVLAAFRLAIADSAFREDTVDATRRALSLQSPTPSAEFEERLAELNPAEAREALDRAVRANPRSSSAWIALGLLEEGDGDFTAADRSMQQAARVDRQYLPAWTLANFYFRRGNRELFWVWADRAASLAYDDLRPLLRLCDMFEPYPRRMLTHFKNPGRLRPPYVDFLIGENRLDDAQQIARAMSEDRANDPRLIDLADRQLRAGNAASAIDLWNLASGFPMIEPSSGKILTNGDLSRAPSNLGFDWHLGQTEGIVHIWRPSELAFVFSGAQPEACVLLTQTLYLAPGHFRLRFDFITGIPAPTGVRWSLDDMEGSPIEPSSKWREGRFEVPRRQGLRDLKFLYRREPGTMRTEGRIKIRNVRLEASS